MQPRDLAEPTGTAVGGGSRGSGVGSGSSGSGGGRGGRGDGRQRGSLGDDGRSGGGRVKRGRVVGSSSSYFIY